MERLVDVISAGHVVLSVWYNGRSIYRQYQGTWRLLGTLDECILLSSLVYRDNDIPCCHDQQMIGRLMKISRAALVELLRAVRKHVTPQDAPNTKLTAYYLDDMTVLFTRGDNPTFFGVVISVLGRELSVVADRSVLVEDDRPPLSTDGGEDEGLISGESISSADLDDDTLSGDTSGEILSVDDDRVIKFLDSFIHIRAHLLETLGA